MPLADVQWSGGLVIRQDFVDGLVPDEPEMHGLLPLQPHTHRLLPDPQDADPVPQ